MTRLGAVALYLERNRAVLSIDIQNADSRIFASLARRAERLRGPFLVRYQLSGWGFFESRNSDEMLDRIEHLRALRETTIFPTRLLIRDVPPDTLPDILRAAAADPERFVDHMVVFRPVQGELTYKSVGPAAPVLDVMGAAWAHSVIGRPFDNGLTDREFDRRTAEVYRSVFETGNPQFSVVRGTLTSNGTTTHQNYTRAVVRLADGSVGSISQFQSAAGPIFHPQNARSFS